MSGYNIVVTEINEDESYHDYYSKQTGKWEFRGRISKKREYLESAERLGFMTEYIKQHLKG